MALASQARLAEIAALPAGELREISYPLLLLAWSHAGRSAVLEMTRKPVEKRIFFEGGVPVDCRSNLVHETFGRFLVSTGKLDEASFRSALADSAARDLPLGEVLLERGLLSADELYKQLQQSLARKLLDGFTWREGSFRATESHEEHGSSLKVRVPQLILTGVLKLSPLEEVTRALRPLFAEPLAVNPLPPVEEVQLRGAAEDVMAALRAKPLRMDELAARLPQVPPNDLGRVMYALSLLELVLPASKAARPPSQITSLPRAEEALVTRPLARPAGPSLPPADLESARNRVLQAYLSYRRKDAVELLAVGETAAAGEVEEAWLRFAEGYAPWSLGAQAPPDLLEKARALFLAGADAYGELRDPERRGQLLQRRRLQREQRANQPRAERIHTDLLDPEAQFQKGMQLVGAGQDKKALELLEYAADLDAQNALYRAEAAWCRFRVTGQSERPLEALEEAVRIDPRSGLAWYYMGMVQGQAGRVGEAEESLRRAIKLMSPDRRPIDALKELTSRKR